MLRLDTGSASSSKLTRLNLILEFTNMQDAVEIAAALQCSLKTNSVSFRSMSADLLARVMREYELKRAPRTHDMVALARYNVNLICCKRTWLVIFRFLS